MEQIMQPWARAPPRHPWPPQVLSQPTPNDWLVKMSLIRNEFNGDYHWLQLPPIATIVANTGKRIAFCFGDGWSVGHKNDLMNRNIHLSLFDPKKQRFAFLPVGRETVIRRDLQYSRNYETLRNRNSVAEWGEWAHIWVSITHICTIHEYNCTVFLTVPQLNSVGP